MMLLKAFLEAAGRYPGQTAFIAGERRLSYAETCFQVQNLAAHIREPRVAIALERGIDAALAILATLYAGGTYIPLDLKNPPQRLQYIVDDADVQCVIGQGACPDWLPQPERWLDIDNIYRSYSPHGNDLAAMDTATPPLWSALAEQRGDNALALTDKTFISATKVKAPPRCALAAHSTGSCWPRADSNIKISAERGNALAAILYTSGSTGNPKGVALSQRAMHNFVSWALQIFELTDQDRIASLAPFYFDLSVFDLFAGLAAGASIHFVPNGLTLAPSKLSQWLAEQHISTWYTVPSLLSFLALKGNLPNTPLPALKRILFAGEVFPTPQLISLCEQLPGVELYNLYGPTETNVCCYWPVDRQRLDPRQAIPIGLPACGSKLHIDPDSGELLVDSLNNLSGYWRQGQLIQQTERCYRTGDKVSLNAQGELLYHGRLDRMLKCSGYRVEPAEIEAALSALPGVVQCAVFGIQDATSGQRPAAALVLQDGQSVAGVAQALRPRLPAYMQPCKYLQLEALPQLSNGKIDYLGLMRQLQ